MKFCLISDLHVDFKAFDLSVLNEFSKETETIVVAGDISNNRKSTMTVLVEIRKLFRNVLFVPGNHDFYGTFLNTNINIQTGEPEFESVEDYYKWYEKRCNQEDIIFLHRDSETINGVHFVGATGWHTWDWKDIPKDLARTAWKQFMPDAGILWTKDLKATLNQNGEILLDYAAADAKFIDGLIIPEFKNVIVSHHIPHSSCVLDKPHDQIWNYLNGSFYSSALQQVAEQNNGVIHAWCFGHTHFPWDKTKGNIRYLCNPRGYPGENPNWTPIMVEV